MNSTFRTLIAASTLLLALPTFADETEDAIKEALEAYRQGSHAESSTQLNYALQLLNQQRLEKLKTVFPAAPAGFDGEEVSADASGSMLGGGLNLERAYYAENARLHMKLNVDSPTIMSMMAVYSNPAMITATGGKMKKVAGQTVVLTGEAKNQEAIVLIDNRIMLSISASDVAESALLDFVKSIDFKKVASY